MLRWQLPAAAALAAVTLVVPLTALPLAVSARLAGAGELAPTALRAASLATAAYAGLSSWRGCGSGAPRVTRAPTSDISPPTGTVDARRRRGWSTTS